MFPSMQIFLLSCILFLSIVENSEGQDAFCPIQNRPPSTPNDDLGRCDGYQDLACCDAQDVSNVEQWLSDNQVTETYGSSPECLSFFDRYYCGLFCAPYQSDFAGYSCGNTNTTNSTLMVGVCEDFCMAFYNACASVEIAPGTTIGDLYSYRDFCRAEAPLNLNVVVRDYQCFGDVPPGIQIR